MFFFIFVVFINAGLYAQQTTDNSDYKITSLTVSSGEGALSSGIFASATIQNQRTKLIFEICSSFFQGMYGLKLGDLFVAGSAGAFNNTMWTGPYVVWTPSDWFSATTWEGFAWGKDGNPHMRLEDSHLHFAYNNIRIDYSIFYIQWSLIHFQKERPNNLPGGGFSIKLGKYKTFIGCDYSLRDDKPLYSAGLTIDF